MTPEPPAEHHNDPDHASEPASPIIPHHSMGKLFVKRTFDIIMSFLLLIALSPFLLLAALLVAGTSRGGAFFLHERVGRNGRTFKLIKFRSMQAPRTRNDQGFEPGDTSRVTAVGSLLRKTKIDELPQLWNVLVGDMSLVGPRPEVPFWTRVQPERWKPVLSMRPGITDPASIEFRNEQQILQEAEDPERCYRDEILPQKLRLSTKYIETWSFPGDLRILARTFFALLGMRTGSQQPNTGQSEP